MDGVVTDEPAPSMSRWSPGSRYRWKKWRSADRCDPERHRQPVDAGGAAQGDILLAQIVRMVSEAQRSRTYPEAGRYRCRLLCSVVVLIAVLTLIVVGFFGPEPRLAHAVINAVAVLIIACPVRWSGNADVDHGRYWARELMLGVLIKTLRHWRYAEKVDTLVVDKTGTLTEENPSWFR